METVTSNNININIAQGVSESQFDGGLLGLLGVHLVGAIIIICTLGICSPWAICRCERWYIEHTIINGHRLKFTGTAMGLFGIWIKIFLLSIITLGIYSFWARLTVKKWIVKHTVFA
ncbi:DUF898 family protein [Abyssisolibacter fermentans]|uniref:DUF898 family protein n=1 Tax=Abyssisolibacter fermentans TaxID=1766203 RepID=UPI00082CBDDF|nr:DUF898 family protein [Abyssisolibacter fermentans]